MISVLVSSLWWFALALTVAAVAYLLLVIASVVAYRPAQGLGWGKPPSVTLLKPLCGLEDGLEEALASFLSQQVQSPVRFVFGVSDANDPALPLARQVAARFPQASAEFVANPAVHGPNPKVSNLINMAATGLDEVVAISDSDIRLPPGALQRAIDALAAPQLGVVTALYRSRPGIAGDKWRQFGALFLDYWFLPMALLHARLAPLSVTYGPLTLVKREVLEKAGGLEALADHLSDDAELGKRVRAAGYAVAFTPDIAETLVNDASHAELFDHELRWSRTVRGLDPLGFVASVVSHPGPLTLLLLLHPGWLAIAGILAPVLLRWLLAGLVERKFGRAESLPRPGPVTLWLRDCYCFAVWAKAFGAGKVGWRGQRLAVSQGDILAS
jgi:ceramide glucosyltransferase